MHRPFGIYEALLKPVFDRLFALIFLALFWWLYLIVAVLVRIKLGSPVIFKQERPGRISDKTGKEVIFKLYKFRSMTDERDEQGNLLPDEVRLTRFGKILRSTSLDELPEVLFNILIYHNMSWVGPRPLLVQYLQLYTKEQRERHLVLPGLTGWAQVNGRNAISWRKKFEFDIEYVHHITFIMDAKIVFKTGKSVFLREGISSETSDTMEDFDGTN